MAEKSRNELFAERWFEQNGFEFKVLREYSNKTVYEISKDGVADRYEILSAVVNMESHMKQFERSFELTKQIAEMGKRGKHV